MVWNFQFLMCTFSKQGGGVRPIWGVGGFPFRRRGGGGGEVSCIFEHKQYLLDAHSVDCTLLHSKVLPYLWVEI